MAYVLNPSVLRKSRPEALSKEKDIANYFRMLEQIIADIYRREGGGDDNFENIERKAALNIPDKALISSLLEKISNLEHKVAAAAAQAATVEYLRNRLIMLESRLVAYTARSNKNEDALRIAIVKRH